MPTATKPKISQIRGFLDLPNDTVVGLPIISGITHPVYGALDLANTAVTIGNLPVSRISGFDVQVRTSRLDQFQPPTSPINLNGQKLTNIGTPSVDGDAVSKLYLDTVVASIVGGAGANNKREFFGGGAPSYTLTNSPAAQSEFIYLNGGLLRSGLLNDYTLVGLTLTMNRLTDSDDLISVFYSVV